MDLTRRTRATGGPERNDMESVVWVSWKAKAVTELRVMVDGGIECCHDGGASASTGQPKPTEASSTASSVEYARLRE